MIMKKLTIAIDGFSSGGKSTFARAIARRLGYLFIDSGAMYRAVALYALRHQLDNQELERAMPELEIELSDDRVFLNGEDVSREIRSIEVSDVVSRISSLSAVRERLTALQRTIGRDGGVVMDGRDIGTVVFPDADLKIFLTADPAVRAKRRFDELGGTIPLAEIERNIRQRDLLDQTREISPLRQAPDAIVLDNSNLTLEQQMQWVEERLCGLR